MFHATRAVEICEAEGPTEELVRALEQLAFTLRDAGRIREAGERISRAVEVSSVLPDVTRYRRTLAWEAWQDRDEQRPRTRPRLFEKAWAIELPAPHPNGDVTLGVLQQDAFSMRAPAGGDRASLCPSIGLRPGVGTLDTFSTMLLTANLANALRLAGQIDPAARIVDPVAAGQ